jgi:hypothetical protein
MSCAGISKKTETMMANLKVKGDIFGPFTEQSSESDVFQYASESVVLSCQECAIKKGIRVKRQTRTMGKCCVDRSALYSIQI